MRTTLCLAMTALCGAMFFACSASDGEDAANNDVEALRHGRKDAGSTRDTGSSLDGAASDAQAGFDSAGDTSTGTGTGTGTSSAAALARKLRGHGNFLIGMGNDLAGDHNQDGAYTLGTTLDLHYCYLVGLQGQGGWPDWNSGGTFVNIMTDSAKAHGVTPMFTLYSMAAWGEGNLSVLTNDQYMSAYWQGAKLLFQRLAAYNDVAAVHLEPDFWGFAESQIGPDPTRQAVHITSVAPDCVGLPNDLSGMGKCLVKLARTYAPKVAVGFHASTWAGSPADIIHFLNGVGANTADFFGVDPLDRDAGCFEAAVDPNCQGRGTSGFYWDESNTTSPNFHEHLAWVKQVRDGLGVPMLWWQVPFGVPSPTPGGSAGHYRDNRVHYLFNHVAEFAAAGAVGAVFGTGAGNQTYITTDNGQFRNAVTNYYATPTPLP